MGCSSSHASHETEETIVRFPSERGVSKEVSVSIKEPRLSFHSMGKIQTDLEDAEHLPPIHSTHATHVVNLELFLKTLNGEELTKAIRVKRVLHSSRQDVTWGRDLYSPGTPVVISA